MRIPAPNPLHPAVLPSVDPLQSAVIISTTQPPEPYILEKTDSDLFNPAGGIQQEIARERQEYEARKSLEMCIQEEVRIGDVILLNDFPNLAVAGYVVEKNPGQVVLSYKNPNSPGGRFNNERTYILEKFTSFELVRQVGALQGEVYVAKNTPVILEKAIIGDLLLICHAEICLSQVGFLQGREEKTVHLSHLNPNSMLRGRDVAKNGYSVPRDGGLFWASYKNAGDWSVYCGEDVCYEIFRTARSEMKKEAER